MIVLAIETSAPAASLALSIEGGVHFVRLGPDPRHGRSVAAGIDDLLRAHGVRPAQLDRIAVAVGPGGYTGLRIGIATANALALVLGRPLRGIDSLAALAARPEVPAGEVLAAIDAGRGAVYAARFGKGADGGVLERSPPEFFESGQVAGLAHSIASNEFVAGTGLASLAAANPAATGRADLAPTAAEVIFLARIRGSDRTEALVEPVLPRYLRPSEAERLWRRRKLERSGPPDEIGR